MLLMPRFILPATGLVLLVASGVLYAMQTGSTRDPEVMADAARRVDIARDIAVPGWTSERIEFTSEQLAAAEAAGGGTVRYSAIDGPAASSSINVMLLCGPHGPISVHPPTACFQGVGYRQVRPERVETIKATDGTVLGTFWVTDFEQERNGVTERIRTWWTWSPNAEWHAATNARMEFAGQPVLYKLYLTEQVLAHSHEEDAESDLAEGVIPDFARTYLPELKKVLLQAQPNASQEL